MAHGVFISYSSKDKVVADTIVAAFEDKKIRCWYAPRDIKPGADWGEEIAKSISESAVFLLIFSSNSNRSHRVLDELNLAISEEKIIIPFRIEKLVPTGAMRLHLSTRHWLDAYTPSWEIHIDKLVNIVSANLKGDAGISINNLEQSYKKPSLTKKGYQRVIGIAATMILLTVAILFSIYKFGKLTGGPSKLVTPSLSSASPTSGLIADRTSTLQIPTLETPILQGTLDISFVKDTFELDPLNTDDAESSTLVSNLFLNLTNLDISQGKIIPEAAESWSISPDGKLYTFKIRSDIPWVTHPIGGEIQNEVDEMGNIRYLTAHDFVYTLYQICNPNVVHKGLGAFFLPAMIKGCLAVSNYSDPKNIPAALFDEIGVKAISDDELLIELENPSAYFLTMTSMTGFTAVPYWAIEKYGDAWKNPGIIPTNGYYVIEEFDLGQNLSLIRNKNLPQDLFGKGNIEEVKIKIGIDDNSAYDLWINSQIDYTLIPLDKIPTHLANYSNEVVEISNQSITFFTFNYRKSPFNNVHVRRAFAAAFDNATYVKEQLNGTGEPMMHIGLPGIVGAPPIDEIGVAYDPVYARSELTAAGYPNCDGFPKISLQGKIGRAIPDQYIRSWENALGCPENTIKTLFGDDFDKANADIQSQGWTIDYMDENNLINSMLSCESNINWNLKRPCNKVDELIVQARVEINPDARAALYYQIEGSFFGFNGEYPIAPNYMSTTAYALHSWIESDLFSQFGPASYNNWIMDVNAKTAK